MAAADDCRRWLPQVTAAGVLPQVAAAGWLPQVAAAGGCRRWLPQGLPPAPPSLVRSATSGGYRIERLSEATVGATVRVTVELRKEHCRWTSSGPHVDGSMYPLRLKSLGLK